MDVLNFLLQGQKDKIAEEEEKDLTEPGLFDIINAISNRSKLIDEYREQRNEFPKAYSSFMINKAFSFHKDTILQANFLNEYHTIPTEAQYLFLKRTIAPKKRFSKWPKASVDELLDIICKLYGWTKKEAQKNMKVLSLDKKRMEEIKEIYEIEKNPVEKQRKKKIEKPIPTRISDF